MTDRVPASQALPRRAAQRVVDALSDTRVVLVNGARQAGKSTLVRIVSESRAAEWRNLDTEAVRLAAEADPTGFVDFPDLMVIDEVQRVPGAIRAR